MLRFLIHWVILSALIASCKSEPYGKNWDEDIITICQYLEINKNEYSKSYRLLNEGKMFSALCGYNPYGEGYTLFLPTDDAIENFIQQNPQYDNFEEMLLDTSFIYNLVRYHTLNKKIHTDDFPDGALLDRTLTGDRLITGFFTDEDDNLLVKVNNTTSIIESNVELTNGYVNVVSEVLQQAETPGYDWLQEQDDYSILAQAMELTGMRSGLWFDGYTILAEHDSVYHRNGIMNIDDLIDRIATPGLSYSNRTNSFYRFTGYHILGAEYYLNDFNYGNHKYWTLGNIQLTINVSTEIRINPGIDTYGITISEAGDTTLIDYVRTIPEYCNIMTRTGPVHTISDLLLAEPLP